MYRSLVVGAVSALALSSSAFAADIYRGDAVSYKDAPVASPATWAGFYIGGHLGGFIDSKSGGLANTFGNDGEDQEDFFDDGKPGATVDATKEDKFSGLVGGVHIGYNSQLQGSAFVVGVEGDVDFAKDINYLASLRGRLGLAHSNVLIYATGGVALIDAASSFNVKYDGYTPINFSGDDRTETGFVVGGGVEMRIGRNWSIGAEGLYYDFDTDKQTVTLNNGDDDFLTVSSEQNLEFWTVRARLTYHIQRDEAPLK